MIGAIVVFGLLALDGDATTPVAGPSMLTIDPCVEIDEATVREVMSLELRDAWPANRPSSYSVDVRCVGDQQEIRVAWPSSAEPEAARTIQLSSVADSAVTATRQARSRELALAIAELIRRHEIASAPPRPAPVVVVTAAPPAQGRTREPGRWQLGVMSTYEHFTGGRCFAGGDLLVGARLGSRFLAEVRVGGRAGSQTSAPGASLSAYAVTAGAAASVLLWPKSRHVRPALTLSAEEYLVRFRLDAPGQAAQSALLGAFILAAGPRLVAAFGKRVALEASVAAGFPLHGITVRVQGTPAESVSGLVLSGSLAGVLRF